MIKKNLTHLHAIVTRHTFWRLAHWAEDEGLTVKDMGRIIDRLVREKALQESTSRRFEEKRADAWRLWPQEKPEEDGEYIVQIEGATQATALWYRREVQEWYEEWYELSGRYEEREVYRIVKWQPLPEV